MSTLGGKMCSCNHEGKAADVLLLLNVKLTIIKEVCVVLSYMFLLPLTCSVFVVPCNYICFHN